MVGRVALNAPRASESGGLGAIRPTICVTIFHCQFYKGVRDAPALPRRTAARWGHRALPRAPHTGRSPRDRHIPYKIVITEVKEENGDGRIDLADVEWLECYARLIISHVVSAPDCTCRDGRTLWPAEGQKRRELYTFAVPDVSGFLEKDGVVSLHLH